MFDPYKRVCKSLRKDCRAAFLRDQRRRFEQWIAGFGVIDPRCGTPEPTDFGTAVRLAVHCEGRMPSLYAGGPFALTMEGRAFYHPGGAVIVMAGCSIDDEDCTAVTSLMARAEPAALARLGAPGLEGILPQFKFGGIGADTIPTNPEITEYAWGSYGEGGGLVLVAFRFDLEDTCASLTRAASTP